MAARRRRCSVVLLSIFSLSVISVAHSQETAAPAGQYASAAVDPRTETAERKAEEPPAPGRWEETEVGNVDPGDAAPGTPAGLSLERVHSSALSEPQHDFREELVIRPLHSGDIYASFQFRTLWKTNFRENKGKLRVGVHDRGHLILKHYALMCKESASLRYFSSVFSGSTTFKTSVIYWVYVCLWVS